MTSRWFWDRRRRWIVSVEMFTAAQLMRRTKNAGGLATARKAERGKRRERRTYVLRGMVRCGVCHRRMAGEMVRRNTFYRCASRTMAPGSLALADHPATVNLREDALLAALNGWIGELFMPENVDRTVAELVGAQAPGRSASSLEGTKARRADADQRLRRFQAAIAAGVVDGINQAQAERTAAQAEIDSAPSDAAVLDSAEVYAMIDSLGDVATVIGEAKPASLQRLYQALNVEVRYEPAEKAAYVRAEPRVDSACVRGGT